jgi:3-deoxy-manno-octulosonate cytidylyltransferase (CMP-KDO synthetase)
LTVLGVIPARYASVRFPGKPLAKIKGRPMVQWVYEAATTSGVFDRVVVATENEDIADCVRGFGGDVEMTSSSHQTGTDRVAEVAARDSAEVVANVQGDQPFVTAAQLRALLEPYESGSGPEMSTVACPLRGDPADPNIVKVVCDMNGRALYFSRSPIPHSEDPRAAYLHHLGLYAFRRDFLDVYATLPETDLERRERLEQLRVLAHGHTIVVTRVDEPVQEVNTPDDLERIELIALHATR